MKTRYTVALLLLGLVLPTGEAVGQQGGPTFHRYLVRAALTAEGLKNLKKQPPTALKVGVTKFVESVGVRICSPMARAAACTSLTVVSVIAASAGLTSTATRAAAGTSSRKSSSRFAANSVLRKLMPVRLPPGRARLATRPSLTGSSPTMKTTGIFVVAALAAAAEGGPPVAAITEA